MGCGQKLGTLCHHLNHMLVAQHAGGYKWVLVNNKDIHSYGELAQPDKLAGLNLSDKTAQLVTVSKFAATRIVRAAVAILAFLNSTAIIDGLSLSILSDLSYFPAMAVF